MRTPAAAHCTQRIAWLFCSRFSRRKYHHLTEKGETLSQPFITNEITRVRSLEMTMYHYECSRKKQKSPIEKGDPLQEKPKTCMPKTSRLEPQSGTSKAETIVDRILDFRRLVRVVVVRPTNEYGSPLLSLYQNNYGPSLYQNKHQLAF